MCEEDRPPACSALTEAPAVPCAPQGRLISPHSSATGPHCGCLSLAGEVAETQMLIQPWGKRRRKTAGATVLSGSGAAESPVGIPVTLAGALRLGEARVRNTASGLRD